MSKPVILVGAPSSASGKTTMTLGLIRAFARRGLTVGSFKVGPDYIDPAYHACASGRPCLNIDSWAMRFDTTASLLEAAGRDADIVIGEGVMGLFDGAPDGTGSTADLAALFNLPVLMVIDVQRLGQSAAAIVDGFRRFREDVEIVSVLLNRSAGPSHSELIKNACQAQFSTPIVGAIDRHKALEIPHRHLGLVQASEQAELEAFLNKAADLIEEHVDLDRLQRLARAPNVSAMGPTARPIPALGQRIAVARDIAFAFQYASVLNGWREQGAEVHFFSPLDDQAPDDTADTVYLPGGYPELHAGVISRNSIFLNGLRAAAHRNAFIYGECGGYMVLGDELIDKRGDAHPMAGLLPVRTSFEHPKLHLGYRELKLLAPTPLGRPPLLYRGHEFHYASELSRQGEPLFEMSDARNRPRGEAGCVKGTVAGSFQHLIDRCPHLGIVR